VLVASIDEGKHSHGAQRGRALQRLGCDVTTVNVVERRGPLGLFRSKDLKHRVEQATAQARPDLVLVIGVPELEPPMVQELKQAGGGTWVNWFSDDLRAIDQIAAIAWPYDSVYAAGSDVAQRLEAIIHREVHLLPLASDPSVYRPARAKDQQYRANVVFAGSATARRERLLQHVVEFGLALWGPGWRGTSLRDYCRGEAQKTEEFVRAYAGASVALNIHHTADGSDTVEAFCNQRCFELAAIGALQVVDRRADLDRWFSLDDELLVFDDALQLRRTVEDALQDQTATERIAVAGRQRVLSEHTYMHRMQEMLTRELGFGAMTPPDSTVEPDQSGPVEQPEGSERPEGQPHA
jgi:spore maturation protein CgeB